MMWTGYNCPSAGSRWRGPGGGCNELSVAVKGKEFLEPNVCKLFDKVLTPLA
jgi:hypothetical protein